MIKAFFFMCLLLFSWLLFVQFILFCSFKRSMKEKDEGYSFSGYRAEKHIKLTPNDKPTIFSHYNLSAIGKILSLIYLVFILWITNIIFSKVM